MLLRMLALGVFCMKDPQRKLNSVLSVGSRSRSSVNGEVLQPLVVLLGTEQMVEQLDLHILVECWT